MHQTKKGEKGKDGFVGLESKVKHDADQSMYTTRYEYSGLFEYSGMIFRINFNVNNHSSGGNTKTIEMWNPTNGFIQIASERDIDYNYVDNFSKLDGFQQTCTSFINSGKQYISSLYTKGI